MSRFCNFAGHGDAIAGEVAMKSSRDQFEDWRTKDIGALKFVAIEQLENGNYRLQTTQSQWEAWQASRQSFLDNLHLS